MIAAFKLKNTVAAGKGASQAHGVHIRFTAGGNIAHLIGAGDGVNDLLGQLDPGAVVREEGQSFSHLLVNGFGNFCITVA